MPIYDYRCQGCGRVSEILVHAPNKGAPRCPVCGSSELERIISASYVIRTGSNMPGRTCCGSTERCEMPPCSMGGQCRRG